MVPIASMVQMDLSESATGSNDSNRSNGAIRDVTSNGDGKMKVPNENCAISINLDDHHRT